MWLMWHLTLKTICTQCVHVGLFLLVNISKFRVFEEFFPRCRETQLPQDNIIVIMTHASVVVKCMNHIMDRESHIFYLIGVCLISK